MAYLAWQIPFAYASIERCLNDVLKRVEGFKPKTLLDFGCGPGTAAVAATTIFSSIKTVDAVDISEQMLILSQRIFSHINALPEHKDVLHYTCKRFLSLCDGAEKSDLVISNMALSDLPDDGVRKITAKELWSRTNDVLVLVERGTPEGARLIGLFFILFKCS